jgi:hypothetical protein
MLLEVIEPPFQARGLVDIQLKLSPTQKNMNVQGISCVVPAGSKIPTIRVLSNLLRGYIDITF